MKSAIPSRVSRSGWSPPTKGASARPRNPSIDRDLRSSEPSLLGNREGPMRRILRSLGATTLTSCLLCSPGVADTPITGITSKMTGVAEELARAETGEPVQARQEAVVRDLDELIAALEKECAACKNGVK